MSLKVVTIFISIAYLVPSAVLSICAGSIALVRTSVPSLCIVSNTLLVKTITGVIFGKIANAKGAHSTFIVRLTALIFCALFVCIIKVHLRVPITVYFVARIICCANLLITDIVCLGGTS